MSYRQDWDERRQIDPQVGFDVISVTEDSTGQIYRASTVYGHNFDNPITVRSSAAYVTGTHSYKTGFMTANDLVTFDRLKAAASIGNSWPTP